MDEKIAVLGKPVLVELVKAAQKKGMIGSKGNWKQFLAVYDKQFGPTLSDPAKRPVDTLGSFLKTFSQEDDLKFLEKILQCRSTVEELKEIAKEVEFPEQRLVCLTLEHPQYLLDYLFPSHEEGWLVTKLSKNKKTVRSPALVAIDCEMVLCEDGTEALVRVCVVDRNLQVKLNKIVNPNKAVADYRTEITGLTAEDLDGVTCSLVNVQKSMKKLLSHGAILVGHGLNNDMQALKLDHARVIDTSLIFKYADESNFRRPSLKNLCKAVLGYEVRKTGDPHNCVDDACAAMKLVLAKLESGFDNVIPLVHEDVPVIERSKLLLHRIPVNVPSEELHKIVPGDFTIEIKTNKRAGGDKYSAFAIFKNQQEANQAFESVNGNKEKDSSGLLQKCASFQLDSGMSGSIYVRKMAHDDPLGQISSRKRPLQVEETTAESKKLNSDRVVVEQTEAGSDACDDHVKEIKRLKQELKQRDEEISCLNKLVVALTRKQGL
jgi:RNA exonuclease 1